MFRLLQAQGYPGSYARVAHFVRTWRSSDESAPKRQTYIPLQFAPGEAFQFDWSCEYAFIAGARRRLEVAHVKLAHSRVFVVLAYPLQSHEMLFDAHARSFAIFGGIPRRGIYDNMKTAVDKVGRGKERTINARFEAMCGHYLFEPEFCNRAAGWEKGVVEKNVQDRRRQLWQGVIDRHWTSLDELNHWLISECQSAWLDMRHPECPDFTLASILEDERPHLMPCPKAFDGYVEHPVRVSATSLVHYQRNRYSVPAEFVHRVVSMRVYPWELVMVADNTEVARHPRHFDKHQTFYDWQHYISAIERKPGALRNGAPFLDMPEPLKILQRHLLSHGGGDRIMAQVLSAVTKQGLEPVLVAIELVLESRNISADHVLNVLARLQSPGRVVEQATTALTLTEEPLANIARYEHLRDPEAQHVH
jgi:transposase